MNIQRIIQSFEKNGYTVSFFSNAEEATAYLDSVIDNRSVGFGDSDTLLRMGLFDRLSSHNDVYDPQHGRPGQTFEDTARSCLDTEVFLTSANALSEQGEIVNMDGSGNRVAGSLFGHEKVYFVVGVNKIMPDLDKAIWRARNVAAPKNAMRLKLTTPCAIRGDRCYDCSSADRICNGMVIHYRCMDQADMELILINQDLGL